MWIDRKSIAGGTSWSAEIVRGIEECTALVVLCSAAALASPNVQQEPQLAWEPRRAILPLLLDPTPLPRAVEYVLAGRQWVEVLDRADHEWVPLCLRALQGLGIRVGVRERPNPVPRGRGIGSGRSNLPAPVTSFVGREKELAEIKRLLHTTRLLTLTGAGGCGKTRLVFEVATGVLDDYPDGVWSVELAPLTDEALVPQSTLAALGLRAVPGQPILETLVDYLRDRSLLLVVDTCAPVVFRVAMSPLGR